MLKSDKLLGSDVEQVMQLVSKGRYSEACRLHHTARVDLVTHTQQPPVNHKVMHSSPLLCVMCQSIYLGPNF